MHKTQPAPEPSGHLVRGLRAKYYDLGNLPLGLPLVTLPHVRLISLQPGQSLLDIGCGSGEVIRRARRKSAGGVSFYGIDPSEDMLEVARHKLRDAPNVTLERGSGEQAPFPDASFDWVVSSLTFHHLPLDLKRRTLQESYRLLRPGGTLLVSDFGRPVHRVGRLLSRLWVGHAFTAENFQGIVPELIREAGFTILSDTVTGGGIHHTLARRPDR